MKLVKTPKVRWGTLVLTIIVLSLIAYNRGYQAAIVVFCFSLAVFMNGWVTIEAIGWVRSRIPPVKFFWVLLFIAVLIDTVAVYLGYGPHVIVVGVFLPIAFAAALLMDDWLRAKWKKLVRTFRER